MHGQSRVPAGKAARMMQLGRLASGILSGAVNEGMRQLANRTLPKPAQLFITPANANRIASRLSEMRGAAMKIGQLLSMEAKDILPQELTDILAQLNGVRSQFLLILGH